MAKASKFVLALVIIVILAIITLGFSNNTFQEVDVYIDGENVTSSINVPFSNVNTTSLNSEICDYTLNSMQDPNSNINSIKAGISDLCSSYGLNDITVNINSTIGENQIPIIYHVEGESMIPTLQNGQTVLVEKTKDISVGDIVVANSDEYGTIVKRVGQIDGSQVYLESDNKNVEIQMINGVLYETRGITTWVDISDIQGVVVQY